MNSSILFVKCPMFDETIDRHPDIRRRIIDRMKDFVEVKTRDSRARFGSNDTPLIAAGHYGGLSHANVTQDYRVFYSKESHDPVIVRLYAVITHVEAGIATPPNIKRQKTMAMKMKGQIKWEVFVPD